MSQGLEIDLNRVVDRLARRIAELEIENAKQDVAIQALAAAQQAEAEQK